MQHTYYYEGLVSIQLATENTYPTPDEMFAYCEELKPEACNELIQYNKEWTPEFIVQVFRDAPAARVWAECLLSWLDRRHATIVDPPFWSDILDVVVCESGSEAVCVFASHFPYIWQEGRFLTYNLAFADHPHLIDLLDRAEWRHLDVDEMCANALVGNLKRIAMEMEIPHPLPLCLRHLRHHLVSFEELVRLREAFGLPSVGELYDAITDFTTREEVMCLCAQIPIRTNLINWRVAKRVIAHENIHVRYVVKVPPLFRAMLQHSLIEYETERVDQVIEEYTDAVLDALLFNGSALSGTMDALWQRVLIVAPDALMKRLCTYRKELVENPTISAYERSRVGHGTTERRVRQRVD